MLTYTTNLFPELMGKKPTGQLTRFNFTRYCRFGEHYLALNRNALCKLGGNTIDGDPIESSFKPFVSNLGYYGFKRIRFLGAFLDSEGDIEVVMTVDGRPAPRSVVFSSHSNGRKYMREPVGSDIEGMYWDFEIKNVDGCWFSFDLLNQVGYNWNPGRGTY